MATLVLRIHSCAAVRARMRFSAEDLARLRSLLAGTIPDETMDRLFEASVRARAGELALARGLLAKVEASEQVLRFPAALLLFAELALRLDDADLAQSLLPRVQALPFPANTWGRTGYFWDGFTSGALGGLHAVLKQWDEAVEALENAIEGEEQFHARPTLVETRLTLASVLCRRAEPGDRARANELLELAEADAVALDMQASLRRLRELRSALQTTGERSATGFEIALVREGEIWTVTSQGKTARLKHSRALDLLKHLLDHPGREFHVLELGPSGDGDGAIDLGDAGELLDQAAKSAYLARLDELGDELAEAERWNDFERKNRAQAELEFLEDELGRAAGTGGKLRRSAGAAERARVNVHKRLRGLIRKIASSLPALGQHLEASISTGLFVSYRP
jgi:hypothetical protein